MGLQANGQSIMDHIHGQISYHCCLSNAPKVKPGYNAKIFLVQLKWAMQPEITKHGITPVKVIPACHVKARCMQLVIIIHRLWMVLKSLEERMERWIVGK
jgi:hypothetical protein